MPDKQRSHSRESLKVDRGLFLKCRKDEILTRNNFEVFLSFVTFIYVRLRFPQSH